MRWLALGACGVVVSLALACSAGGSGGENGSGAQGGGGTGGSSGSGATGGFSGGGGSGAVAGGGSGGGTGGGECFATSDVPADQAVLPADVIWTIDTSGSMTEETAAVRENMNLFSEGIKDVGVDIRVILIAEQYEARPFGLGYDGICIDKPLGSGQCPADTNPPDFAHLYQTVGSTNSLQLMVSTFDTYKSLLRPNSVKIFVVVTDDNSLMSAADFTSAVNTLDPALIVPDSWKFYGIYCFTDCNPWVASVGTVYEELRQQTGGVAGDLCLQDFLPVFGKLANGVIGDTKLKCGWAIPAPPEGETFDPNKINVNFTDSSGNTSIIYKVPSKADCGPEGGWYYDNPANPQNVLVCDATCQAIQAEQGQGTQKPRIDIQFGCATEVIPR